MRILVYRQVVNAAATEAIQKKISNASPADIRRVLSKQGSTTGGRATDGIRTVKMANVIYKVSTHSRIKTGSLIDRGANGGVAGDDVRVISSMAVRRLLNDGVEALARSCGAERAWRLGE